MEPIKKLSGRPKLKEGKRTKFINVRFTEDEYKDIAELEKQLGITKTDLIRMRLLSDAKKTVINSRELIKYLDDAGAEMGRIGNNINQLAKHANTLKLKGALNSVIIDHFNRLFREYIHAQQQFEVSLRRIIRAMGI
ncbi:MAG TPA: plasmid mobilization relaxosome protein MobC [Candidatus Babeliaceae bacterium]|nr:plasmid mobilization relaxosome protein MobC [Candidatus Babeliaceae bacterium]